GPPVRRRQPRRPRRALEGVGAMDAGAMELRGQIAQVAAAAIQCSASGHADVADALERRRPVVALESTLIAHGLPRPENLDVARELEATVRRHGAVPA